MKLFIDGDAFPNLLKQIVLRAIEKQKINTIVIANKKINIGASNYIKYIIVFGRAFDVAFIDGKERKSTVINGYPVLYIPLSLNKLDDVKHLFAVKDKLFKAITYINNKRIYG